MGYAAGFHPIVSILLTVGGMMTTVVIFTFLGDRLRKRILSKYFKQRKVFTQRNRRLVRIWKKYGVLGISFLTPILLSPPGGSIIAVALGGSPKKTILYMLFWSIFWSTIITYAFYYSGDSLRAFLGSRP